MTEFTIDNHVYRMTKRMNAFTQMDVLSKFLPVMSSGFVELVPLFMKVKRDGIAAIENESMDVLMATIQPIAKALSDMTREDRFLVVSSCLSLCQRRDVKGEGWSPIWNEAAGCSMFDDIETDAIKMLKIVYYVMREQYDRFSPGFLSTFTGTPRQ